MSSVDERRGLQTRERAFEDAWIVYQKQILQRSVQVIATLSAAVAIRLGDGSFSPEGGLGRPLAVSTIYWRLSEAMDQYREAALKRPIVDMVLDHEQRLENLASLRWNDAMKAETFAERHTSLEAWLKVNIEIRRLLGIDRPQQVEVTHDVKQGHDDPATVALNKAMADAEARKQQLLADLQDDAED